MRNACWIPNATNIHLQYVILIAFPLQQQLQERASLLTFYVHCPSPRTHRSPVLCKLSVALPFQTSYPQSTDVPLGDALPLCICGHKSRHSLVCVFLQGHDVMRRATNVRLLTVLIHYLYWEQVSGNTVDTCEHTWNIRNECPNFENFYCRRGKV